jgi:hypothetical protein
LVSTDLYSLWIKAVWTTLVGFADAATPSDVRFAVPLVLALPLPLEFGLVFRAAEPLPLLPALVLALPLVRGEAFPASAGCGFSVRSLPGLLVGGAMEAVLVGVMSMASEGDAGAGSWWGTLAPVRIGIGFGREVGERWSWGKDVRGNDSVAAIVRVRATVSVEVRKVEDLLLRIYLEPRIHGKTDCATREAATWKDSRRL